jgi:hypothetical protein
MHDSAKVPKIGIGMSRVQSSSIDLRAKETDGMARTQSVVGTDVGVMARDIDVPHVLPCIQIGPYQRLKHIDVASKEHVTISHNVRKDVEVT